jgi:endonuclease YncB( thermonuclease family)
LFNPFSRRRRGSWQYLVLVLIGVSVYEYTQTGAVTWHLEALRELREIFYDYRPSSAPQGDDAPASDLAGRVTKVADGDTFTLRLEGRRDLRIRMFAIDAPESDQPYGQAAKRALSDKLLSQDVRIVLQDVDNYGRMVSTVYLGGRDINLEQVQSGLAWWYRDFAPDDRAMREAETAARNADRGLWQDADPTPPWEWRRQ